MPACCRSSSVFNKFNKSVIIVSPSSSATKQAPVPRTRTRPTHTHNTHTTHSTRSAPSCVRTFRHRGITGPCDSECLSMAASPNTATRSRSSSAATPDAISDDPIDNIGCSHISALLADPTESDPLLKRFRRVVTWKAQRTHEALHSAKRRKVCLIHAPCSIPAVFSYLPRSRSRHVGRAN